MQEIIDKACILYELPEVILDDRSIRYAAKAILLDPSVSPADLRHAIEETLPCSGLSQLNGLHLLAFGMSLRFKEASFSSLLYHFQLALRSDTESAAPYLTNTVCTTFHIE